MAPSAGAKVDDSNRSRPTAQVRWRTDDCLPLQVIMITSPPMKLTNHTPTVQVVQPWWSGASGALACTLSHGAIQGGHPRLRSVSARGSSVGAGCADVDRP
jgi:hypothetical protein